MSQTLIQHLRITLTDQSLHGSLLSVQVDGLTWRTVNHILRILSICAQQKNRPKAVLLEFFEDYFLSPPLAIFAARFAVM